MKEITEKDVRELYKKFGDEKPVEELKNEEKCFLWLACWVRSYDKKEKENEQ